MAKPKITCGHGFLDDGNDAGVWVEVENGNVGTCTSVYDDYLYINITSSSGNKIYYVFRNITNISSDVYTKCLFRYKTAGATKAKIVLSFSDESTQTVLDETSSSFWNVGIASVTSGKLIDTIYLYANAGVGSVYYDFVLLCKNQFEFPNAEHRQFTPPPRYAILKPPTRVGDITQNLGSESATFTCTCNLDVESETLSWKRAGDYMKGEVFIDIAHNSYREPWQWLDTGLGQQFKATLENLVFHFDGENHRLDLLFREYSRSNKSYESHVERFGLNL